MTRVSGIARFTVLYLAGFVLLVASGTVVVIFLAMAITMRGALHLDESLALLVVTGILALVASIAAFLIDIAPSDDKWPPSIVNRR